LRGQKKVSKEKATLHSASFLRLYENHPWFSPCGPAYRLFKFAPGKFVAFVEGNARKSCDARGYMKGL